MSGPATTGKFGRPTAELSFDASVYPSGDTLSIQFGPKKVFVDNWLGELSQRMHRRLSYKSVSVTIHSASEEEVAALKSIAMIGDDYLSYIYANANPVYSERYTTTDTTHLTLKTNPYLRLDKRYNELGGAAIVTIGGVWTGYDAKGAQVAPATNYYSGGSFARATWIVTLGSSPGAAGTAVYVNYTYTGILCVIDGDLSITRSAKGGAWNNSNPAWDITMKLRGV